MADASFSDYLARAQKLQGLKQELTGKMGKGTFDYGTALPPKPSKVESQGGGDPVSWLIDILSRPLYTVTNVPNQILNEEAKRKEAQLNGTDYDEMGAIGNVLSAPFRGLTSTNPEDKITTAQLIEKQSDVSNIGNPNYVDTQNNVNPVVAGSLGFVGDVGLDLSNYIPIAGWVGKGLKVGGAALKAGTRGALTAEAAAQTLRKGKNVAGSSVEDLAAAERAVANFGDDTVQDIKEPTITPKGTTSDESVAEDIVNVTDQSVAQAAEAAQAAKAGAKVEDIEVDLPPTVGEIMAKLPTAINGRSRPAAIGNVMAALRKNQPKAGRLLDFDKWKQEVTVAINRTDKAKGASPVTTAIRADLGVPEAAATRYQDYVKAFEANAGMVNPLGVPLKRNSGFRDMNEWVGSVPDTEIIAKYPTRFAKPAGATGLLKKDVQEFLSSGTLNGKKLTEKQAASVNAQLTEAFDLIGGPTNDTLEGFASRIKKFLDSNGGVDADALVGAQLAGNMRKMKPEKLAYTAKLLEDITSGEHNLDTFVPVITGRNKKTGKETYDSYSSTVNAFAQLVGIDDLQAYNLMRRKAISEINSAKSKEYAAAIRAGRSVEDMMVQAGFTSNEGKRVADWFPTWLGDLVKKGDSEFVTDTGVKRTADTMGEGYAFDLREIGTHEGWNMVKHAEEWAIKEAKRRGLSGAARAKFVQRETLLELSKAEKMLDNFGWPMWISIHHKGARFLVSPSQFMSIMSKVDDDLALKTMFNFDTAGPYTFMVDAVVESLIRKKPISRNRLEQILSGDATAEYYKTIDKFFDKPKQNGFVEGGVFGRSGKDSVEFSAEDLIDQFEEALPKMVQEIEAINLKNAKDYQTRFKSEALDLSENAINDMEALAADPARVGRMLAYIDNLEQNIAKKGKDGAALDVSILRAIEVALKIVPKGTRTFAEQTAKAATKVKKAASAEKLKTPAKTTPRAKTANNKKVDKEAEEVSKPNLEAKLDAPIEDAKVVREADPLYNAGSDTQKMSDTAASNISSIRHMLHMPDGDVWGAVAGRINRNYNLEHVSNMWHSIGGLTRQLRYRYTHRLKALEQANKKFGDTNTPLVTKIFSDVQAGNPTPGYEKLYEEIRLLTAEVNDVTGEYGLLGDPFFRNQQGVEKINEYLKMAGVDDKYLLDLDDAARQAEANGTDLWTEASTQWREIVVDDPIQYFAQKHAALMKLNTHIAVAKDFKRMAVENGLISSTPKPGFVKTNDLDGFFFEFIDDTDVYFDATIVKELQYLSDISEASRSMGGKLGHFINKYFLPIQNSWKYAITLPRPGHHVRNAIGDASLTYMAEGAKHYMRSSNDAFKILSIGKSYDDVDFYAALRDRGVNEVPNKGDVLVEVNGQKLTAGWAHDAIQKQGLMPTYHVGEDYVDDIVEPSFVSKLTDKLTLRGGKIEETAGKVSEARDHWARSQHFMQIIRKEAKNVGPGKKYKSLDELVEYAGKRVKKFHPDSTMLTAWEAKYMRTLIPFYSWFRGALPAIVEATVMYPGRFMVFPKASFNLAYAMGLNPYSLSDPFPDDQMFPSFLTEDATGPQFKIGGNYFGMNPGIAALDVYNQIGTGEPLRGIAGMTSPLLRVPLELMSGGAWGTGARIKDPSDYVDASIPGINYLSNITGVSPTGSVSSFLQGKGLDMQYQVDAGNKTPADQATSLLNWLTGLGFQNMSKQNYIDYAEIERRNAAAKDQRSAY